MNNQEYGSGGVQIQGYTQKNEQRSNAQEVHSKRNQPRALSKIDKKRRLLEIGGARGLEIPAYGELY